MNNKPEITIEIVKNKKDWHRPKLVSGKSIDQLMPPATSSTPSV